MVGQALPPEFLFIVDLIGWKIVVRLEVPPRRERGEVVFESRWQRCLALRVHLTRLGWVVAAAPLVKAESSSPRLIIPEFLLSQAESFVLFRRGSRSELGNLGNPHRGLGVHIVEGCTNLLVARREADEASRRGHGLPPLVREVAGVVVPGASAASPLSLEGSPVDAPGAQAGYAFRVHHPPVFESFFPQDEGSGVRLAREAVHEEVARVPADRHKGMPVPRQGLQLAECSEAMAGEMVEDVLWRAGEMLAQIGLAGLGGDVNGGCVPPRRELRRVVGHASLLEVRDEAQGEDGGRDDPTVLHPDNGSAREAALRLIARSSDPNFPKEDATPFEVVGGPGPP